MAVNGALGVGVADGGRTVRVGGTSEKGVFVKNGVKVGRGVLLGVNSSVGLAVHVAWSWMGVTVSVASCSPRPPGGRILNEDCGLIKIHAKYPAMQAVRTNTSMESISQSCMELPRARDCFPS